MNFVSGREFELKLELTHQELQRVDAHPALRDLTLGQPVIQTLRSIYFDTPDHRLRREGISLRLRSDGEGWVQTVKAGTRVANGVSHPNEVEVALQDPEPELQLIDDSKLRKKITTAIKGSALGPVFETIVTRTTRRLHSPKGEIELALDQGVVRSGKAEEALCEAELELKSGTPDCLLEVATKLFSAEPVRLAQSSKAERGYDLALGRKDASATPTHAGHVELEEQLSCADALQRFLQSAAAQIVSNRVVVLETDDPEGAHQLRIGLRRLRTALKAFRPLSDIASMREMDRHARALSQLVGELRDADILMDNIFGPVAGRIKGHAGMQPLRQALLVHRTQKREEVRSTLRGPHWSTLQLYLALWPRTFEHSKALDEPVAKFAGTVLEKAWKKVAKYGEHLDYLDDQQRHEMRKAAKHMRYTVELFGSLYDAKGVAKFVKNLKKLQELFGYVNDVVTADRLNAICDERCADNRAAQRAAGFVLGWHAAEAQHSWEAARKRWRSAKKAPQFWR
jgi:inorganic triphosphatase YgiF